MPAPAELKRVSIGSSFTPSYNYNWGAQQYFGHKYSKHKTADVEYLHKELSLREFKGVFDNVTDAEIEQIINLRNEFESSYCIFQANPDDSSNRQKYLGNAEVFTAETHRYTNGHAVPFKIREIEEV